MSSPKKPDKYEAPSWDYIYKLCIQVVDQIRGSGYKPGLLVAISRGGWVPGRILSDLLDNLNIATIKAEHYIDIYKTHARPKITQPLPIEVDEKRILLVDDIADSGKSLKLVKKHLFDQGAADVKICALYCKPWSIVIPDFLARRTDAWIIFPHEIYESMKKIIFKLKGQGKSREEMEAELARIGIKRSFIKKFAPQILAGG